MLMFSISKFMVYKNVHILIKTNHEMLQLNKRSLVNVPKMFERQDKKAQIPEGLLIFEENVDWYDCTIQ